MKVLLILVDGMRSDALEKVEKAQVFMKKSAYTLQGETVMPSVTLPCHMSLFHSVDPGRHGTTTNTFAPQVRPINGLCDVLASRWKTCSMFYNWEQLRDLSRPGSLAYSYFAAGSYFGYEIANQRLAVEAASFLQENPTDFTFLYLGEVDAIGHRYGWMSDEYQAAVERSWAQIEYVADRLSDQFAIIVTADHGGHGRTHGTELPEDMTIPVFFYGKDFSAGESMENVSIKDIAPTVAALLQVEPDQDWEGRCLLSV